MEKIFNPELVIYHKGCADGMAAAWVFWQHAKSVKGLKMPEFYGANYGDKPIPTEKILNKTVVIVDFSYDRETTETIKQYAKKLVILDHHKSHEKALAGLPYAIFNMNKSGCQMAWDYIYPPDRIPVRGRPTFLNYIADRDLWTWKMPSSKAINKIFFMKGHTSSFEEIDKLKDLKLDEMAKEGKAFLQYEEILIEKISRFASTFYLPIEDNYYKILLVEATFLISELGNHLSEKNKDHDFVVIYRYNAPVQTWFFSCRGNKDSSLDIGGILRPLGGGGHPKAAGFEVKSPEWPKHLFLSELEMIYKGVFEKVDLSPVDNTKMLKVDETCLNAYDQDVACRHKIELNNISEIWNGTQIYDWYERNFIPIPVHFLAFRK